MSLEGVTIAQLEFVGDLVDSVRLSESKILVNTYGGSTQYGGTTFLGTQGLVHSQNDLSLGNELELLYGNAGTDTDVERSHSCTRLTDDRALVSCNRIRSFGYQRTLSLVEVQNDASSMMVATKSVAEFPSSGPTLTNLVITSLTSNKVLGVYAELGLLQVVTLGIDDIESVLPSTPINVPNLYARLLRINDTQVLAKGQDSEGYFFKLFLVQVIIPLSLLVPVHM